MRNQWLALSLCASIFCAPLSAQFDGYSIIPHIASADNWENLLSIANQETTVAQVDLLLFEDGQALPEQRVQIQPDSELIITLNEGQCGFIFWSTPKIFSRLVYRDLVRNGSAEFALNADQDDEIQLYFPQYEGDNLAWAGFAVMNPQTFAMPVSVEALSAAGASLDSKVIGIEGLSRFVSTLDSVFPGVDPRTIASISCRAIFPVAGLSIASIAQGQLLFLPAALESPPTPDDADLKAFLNDWFKDYNQGKGTDYLEAEFELFEQGDPSRPSLPQHVFYRDVAYGPFERNLLDFWQAESDDPTPVVVYIHGGGFQGGDKSTIDMRTLEAYLAEGISVAAIIYRWAARSGDAAINMDIPNGEGTEHDVNGARLDYILRDTARSIQFLRFKAKGWNIDGSKIAAYGGSAGAGSSMWIGTVPDLAVRNHPDPVLRESTRICGIGHTNSQPTYYWLRWPEHLDFSPEFLFANIAEEDTRVFQLSREDQIYTQKGMHVGRVCDFWAHMTPDDPPIMTINWNQDRDQAQITSIGEIIHHPRGHVAIYDRAQEVGIPCEIATRIITESPHDGDLVAFFMDLWKP